MYNIRSQSRSNPIILIVGALIAVSFLYVMYNSVHSPSSTHSADANALAYPKGRENYLLLRKAAPNSNYYVFVDDGSANSALTVSKAEGDNKVVAAASSQCPVCPMCPAPTTCPSTPASSSSSPAATSTPVHVSGAARYALPAEKLQKTCGGDDKCSSDNLLNLIEITPRCEDLPPFHTLSPHLKGIEEIWSGAPSVHVIEEYHQLLIPYMECRRAAPKVTKRPADRPIKWDCSNRDLWKGPREKPVKIIDIFPFSHELDILELRLYELNDVVDQFVIFENHYTHRVAKKPLFFERNKGRYKPFLDKILHVVADESLLYSGYAKHSRVHGDDWRGEHVMRWIPWERLVQAYEGTVPQDAMFMHGDLDEVPSAEAVAHFKYCEPVSSTPYSFVMKFFQHNFDSYLWDQDLPNIWYPHSIERRKDGKGLTMPRGQGSKVIRNPSGWTFNRFFTEYFDVYKELALAEGGHIDRMDQQGDPDIARKLTLDPTIGYEWHKKGWRSCCRAGDMKHSKPRPAEIPVPWYPDLNKHRFPHLFPKYCGQTPTPADCVP